jgi:hypothetical protein
VQQAETARQLRLAEKKLKEAEQTLAERYIFLLQSLKLEHLMVGFASTERRSLKKSASGCSVTFENASR